MKRRHFLTGAAAAAVTFEPYAPSLRAPVAAPVAAPAAAGGLRLTPPARGKIPVAFVMGPGATMIDFAGPWEVFQDVMVPERSDSHDEQMPFQLFTVAERGDTLRVTGGMQVTPDYTIADAPPPRVIVIPAHRGSPALVEWIRRASDKADLTLSVCTGAFHLARTGLLKGRTATTHHQFLDQLAREFPDIQVQRGRRFVEHAGVATAGGLTSGIDLALRVVERYFGRSTAERTAAYLEYESRGWIV
jgi:transcriptional regulator GlxA family with amidase domain